MSDRYPEHLKLHAVRDKSQSIGEFVDWLDTEKGISLCRREGDDLDFQRVFTSTTDLLAEFFEIDLKKLEIEKDDMLEAQRALNEKQA